jgi:mannose-6-phosphate isomerase-like protein (cupin superfamily)
MKRFILLAVVAATLAGGAIVAWATPPAGIAGGPIVARGTVSESIVLGTPTVVTVTKTFRFRIRGKVFVRKVTVKVPSVRPLITCGASPCDTAVQQVTINPQGHTGWHTHPGPTFVAVAQGEGTLYHGGETGCTGHKYATNSGFFQPSADVHTLRNEGTSTLTVFALYVLPSGTPNTAIRTDQAQPSNCPSIP